MKHLRVVVFDGIYSFTEEEAKINYETLYRGIKNGAEWFSLQGKEYGQLLIQSKHIISIEIKDL